MWRTMKLGEICDVLDNLRKPISKKNRVEGDYPYYGATGIVDWVKDYIFDEKLVLVGEDGAKWSSGDTTAFIATGKYWVNNHAHVLRPKPELVIHEWISYYLTGIDLSEFVTGLTVPKLNQANLRSIPIPLPPLSEQQRIVAKLDTVFAEIDKAIELSKSEEDSIKNFRTSLLSDIFINNTIMQNSFKLKDVVTYEKVNAQGSSLLYLGMENISSETMQIVDELKIPTSTSSTFKFNKTHVLYGRLRPYLKKVLVPNFDGQCSTEIFCLKPSSNLNRKFLAYWLISPKISDKIENTSTGARMPRANMNALLDFDFFLPSLDEQERIVAKLNDTITLIETIKIINRQKRENYAALKSSILKQQLQREIA